VAVKRAQTDHPSGPIDADERAELERLRVENAARRMDREFWKAASFFAAANQGR